jgi:hypothetical protein
MSVFCPECDVLRAQVRRLNSEVREQAAKHADCCVDRQDIEALTRERDELAARVEEAEQDFRSALDRLHGKQTGTVITLNHPKHDDTVLCEVCDLVELWQKRVDILEGEKSEVIRERAALAGALEPFAYPTVAGDTFVVSGKEVNAAREALATARRSAP